MNQSNRRRATRHISSIRLQEETIPLQATRTTASETRQSSWSLANRRLAQHFLAGAEPWRVQRGTFIVVPSLSLGNEELLVESGADPIAEQRLMSLVLLLGSPEVKLVYASAKGLPTQVIDSLMQHLPDPESARARFTSVTTSRPGPLARALLDDPRAFGQLKEAADASRLACLLSFDVTAHEQALAARLSIPVLGSDPEHKALCTKSGARKLALENGIPIPRGAEDIACLGDAARAVEEIAAGSPRAIIKLNDGFGGLGNVIVDSSQPGVPLEVRAVTFGDPIDDWTSFARKLERSGGVVEAVVGAGALASPSAQLFISPDGDVSVISTQDQIMGGPTGQACVGCASPASLRYRHTISRHALTMGRALSDAGVWGFVGVDFLAEPAESGSRIYMGEINLRMGATAPPNLYLRMLLDGADGTLLDDPDQSPAYVVRDLRVPGKDARDRVHRFDSDAARGLVPYCVDPEDPSKASVMAIGKTRREALGLLRAVGD